MCVFILNECELCIEQRKNRDPFSYIRYTYLDILWNGVRHWLEIDCKIIKVWPFAVPFASLNN